MNNLEKYLDQVVEQKPANFETPVESGSETTSNLVAGVLRRWYIVLLVFFVMCAIGIPAIWLLMRPLYSVTGALRVAPILTNIITGEIDQGGISNYSMYMQTQAEMITSDTVVQRVADNLADKDLSFFENEPTDLITKLKRKLKGVNPSSDPFSILKRAIFAGVIGVAPGRRTELMTVSMKSTNPGEAGQIVDAFINAYMAVEVTSTAQDRDRNLSLLENERKVLVEKLQSRRQQLRQLADEYGSTDLVSRQDMELRRVTTLLSELTRIEAQRISLEANLQFLEQAKEQAVAPEELLRMRNEYVNSDPMVQELTREIIQLERDLIVSKQALAPENPALRQKQQILDIFRSQLQEKHEEISKSFDDMVSNQAGKVNKEKLLNAQAELEQTKLHESRLREILAQQDIKTKEVGRTQLDIEDLQFQLQFDQEMYDTVLRRTRELEFERKRPARVTVAYNASTSSVRDKRVKYSAALIFFAFASGCGLAFLRDKADKRLRAPGDVAKRIGIRIIGTTTSSYAVKPSIFSAQIAGDYQTIRANLGLLNSEGIPKKVVVTSPSMREGKTTFAINLAISISRSGKKVLLIDGDLRKPDIAYLLNLPRNSKGLEDVLLGTEFEQVICSISSADLDVLASHSYNGVDVYELITSPLTARQINRLTERYDHIIIDTPPVLAFPDALIWAKIAGNVILTSFAGQTTSVDLTEAKGRFEQISVKVLGTVLGNVPVGHSYYRYGYHHRTQKGRSRKKTKQTTTKLLLPVQSGKNKANGSD